MDSLSANRRQHRWTGLVLVGLAPLGLYSKVYAGPVADWINNSLGSVFYVLFWRLLVFWLQPRVRPWRNRSGIEATLSACPFGRANRMAPT